MSSISPFDKIRLDNGESFVPEIKGQVWVHILVEYDTHGNSKILKSWVQPAKDSSIKKKEKPKVVKKEMSFKKEESSSLF
jgi:hypothetical protein